MAFSSLWSWWTRPPWPLDHVRIVLYTRRGCHLCDDALAVLERARRTVCFGLEVIDIDADPKLVEQYGHDVPVVTVDGKVRFRGRVNEVLVRRLLRAEAKNRQ
jgi:glutaredoxin